MMVRPSPPGARGLSGDRILKASLPLALAAGLALRLWLLSQSSGLTMDSPLYVNMAESLARGEPALGPAHHGYPALLALAMGVVPGREWPGRVVSLLAGLALLGVVYGLARRTLSAPWASLATWLVALHPLVAVFSGSVMTESSFLVIAYGGLLLVERARFLAGGALLGLGYVIRPETLVVAPFAALLARGRMRGGLLLCAGFAAAAIPYLGYLRWERDSWSPTPKIALVRPMVERARDSEWRVRDNRRALEEEPKGLFDRVRWAAPSIARSYLPNLDRHARRLLQAWPVPLLALSLAGLLAGRRAIWAPLALLGVWPILAVPFDIRFSQLLVPALAVLAAEGAALGAKRLVPRGSRSTAVWVATLVALAGLGWAWAGRAGRWARHFDEGPMAEMRQAGEWLKVHGRPGALVMDRKSYVPFFAGMRHIQLPDDDYDTILDFARESGTDYLVIEEFVVVTLRPQLLRLVQDREFRLAETRVRQAFVTGVAPMSGVAVFEVMREPGAGSSPSSR